MARLISYDIYDEVFDLLSNSERSIRIVSPFIGLQTAKDLSELVRDKGIRLQVITRFSRSDFFEKVSSVEGLGILKNVGAELKAVRQLHTKLYIFDSHSAIIGSSNFTRGGLITNLELNVLLDDDPEIVDRSIDYFNEMEMAIPPEFVITQELIDNELKVLADFDRSKTREFDERKDFGFVFQAKSKNDIFEQALLSKRMLVDQGSTAWIKFEGFSDSRRTRGDTPILVELSDGLYKTHFPKRPTGFRSGDIVFVGRNSFDREGKLSSLIFGYGIVRKWEKSQEVSKALQLPDSDAARWPYYVYIENFRFLTGTFRECPSIHDIYSALGKEAFPSTLNRIVSAKDLSRMHSQKDKLRITDKTKEFLLKEFSVRKA